MSLLTTNLIQVKTGFVCWLACQSLIVAGMPPASSGFIAGAQINTNTQTLSPQLSIMAVDLQAAMRGQHGIPEHEIKSEEFTVKTPPRKFGTSGIRWDESDYIIDGVFQEDLFFNDYFASLKAVAAIMKQKGRDERPFVIGYDTRQTGPYTNDVLARLGAEFLAGEGIPVLLCESHTPVPVVSLLIVTLEATGGYTLTASHNPGKGYRESPQAPVTNYNGIKFNPEDGGPADVALTDAFGARANELRQVRQVSRYDAGRHAGHIKVLSLKEVQDIYINAVGEMIDFVAIKAMFEQGDLQYIVFDAKHGAAAEFYRVMAQTAGLLEGRDFEIMNGAPDSSFGGLRPEPDKKYSQKLIDRVQEVARQGNKVVGLTADPDGDRNGVVNVSGEFIDPNMTLALQTQYALQQSFRSWLQKKNIRMQIDEFLDDESTRKSPVYRKHLVAFLKENKPAVGKSIPTSNMINAIGDMWGATVYETKTGFKWFREFLKPDTATPALIVGEESQGLNWRGKDNYVVLEKDAMLAGFKMLELNARTGQLPQDLAERLQGAIGYFSYNRGGVNLLEQTTKDKVDELKQKYQERLEMMKMLLQEGFLSELKGRKIKAALFDDGYKIIFDDDSWFAIRFSGTEPVIRLYTEAKGMTMAEAEKIRLLNYEVGSALLSLVEDPLAEAIARHRETTAKANHEFLTAVVEEGRIATWEMPYVRSLLHKFSDEVKRLLRIIDNFTPTSHKTDEELAAGKTVAYGFLKSLPVYNQPATDVMVWGNPLNGGLGSSVKRRNYLEKLWNLVGRRGPVKEAAKGQDLYFYATVRGYDEHGNAEVVRIPVSITEMKYIQAIKNAEMWGRTVIQEVVNRDSKDPIERFFDETIYLFDRVDRRPHAPKRTYRQVINETQSLDLHPLLIVQGELPTVGVQTGKLTLERTAPGGHGEIGFLALADTLTFVLSQAQGKTLLRVVYNGDGPNNFIDNVIGNYMAQNRIPILMLTTTKMPLDMKGGMLGTERLADGTEVDQIMEKAQAEKARQLELFYRTGLANSDPATYGRPGKQQFNTNIAVFNYSVLVPFMKELYELIGPDTFYAAISPDLIENLKEQGGKYFTQLEGAMASAILNFNRYLVTTKDQRIKDLMKKHGIEQILHKVNLDEQERELMFTPEKMAIDHWYYSMTDHFSFDTETFKLINNRPGHLSRFELPVTKGKFYEDISNLEDAFGHTSTLFLDILTVSGVKDKAEGIVNLSTQSGVGPILKGEVSITTERDGFDLAAVAGIYGLLNQDGRLELNNVSVYIHADGTIEVTPKDRSASADQTHDVKAVVRPSAAIGPKESAQKLVEVSI